MENEKKKSYKNLFSIFNFSGENKKESKTDLNNFNKNMWIPDDKAQACYNCQKQFSAIFLRKHHCRICGNVFCKDCSDKTVEGKYWGTHKEIKVCDYCYQMYKKLDETLVETIIDNQLNYIEDIDSIDDNIKNLRRETKLSEYCKKAKKETEETYKFLQMDKKQEEPFKSGIDSHYDMYLRETIESILKNEGLYERWFDKIYDLTKKTIQQINPSFKDLKDSLNINDYIKIRTIVYKDQSLCKVIDGFVLEKNVCSKKMNTNIDNPRILLLDCGLDFTRNNDSITCFENLMVQEPAYFNIIYKKIEQVDPNVILVNKNVSRKVQEHLDISNKISLVMNVKSKSLKKIARCTKTYVLPSTDLIDKQTILGTCKKFRIEKIKNFQAKPDPIKSNDINLMIFEGCDQLLSATIILSGPDEQQLKSLKKLMRTILLTARDLYLQKYLVYFSFSDYKTFNVFVDNTNLNLHSTQSRDSGASIISMSHSNGFYKQHNPVASSALSIYNKCTMENFYFISDFRNGFDISILNESYKKNIFNCVKLTMVQGMTLTQLNVNNLQLQPGSFSNNNELAEQDILKLVNSVCEETQELQLNFFHRDEYYDKPLGKMILDLCNENDQKCDSCKKLKSNHIYYIYKKTGRIKIQMIQSNEDCLEKVMEYVNKENCGFSKINNFQKGNISHKDFNYNLDIFSYGFCKICNKVCTPLIKLPREFFNYSVSKFFKNMLFNHQIPNRTKHDFNIFGISNDLATNNCNHYVNRDISRIFITKIGTVKFSYEQSPLYIIEPSPMNERKNNSYFKFVLETYLNSALLKSAEIIEYLRTNFKHYLDEFERWDLPIGEEHKTQVKEYIERCSKIINKYIQIISDIKTFSENLLSVPSRFDDYVKAMVYIKKIYFRIIQVKMVYNYIRRAVRKLKRKINYYYRIKIISATEKDSSVTIPNLLTVEETYSNNFTNIDNKETYRNMLREISFYDDDHNKYSSDINEYDISSIIAYGLTSDKYREIISPSNKFKLIDIKCERKVKSTNEHSLLNGLDTFAVSMCNSNNNTGGGFKRIDSHTIIVEDQVKNYGYNYMTQDEEIYESSLLFDGIKNIYNYQNLDNHKINQQLETELLSDEKTHVTVVCSSSNLMNILINSNMPIEYYKKNNEHVIEEKFILQADHIKQTIEEIEGLITDMRVLKKQNTNDEKKLRENNKIEFPEDNLITPLECEIMIYFPRQFEALRISYCATYDEFILSIAKSAVWSNVTGGKSKADFYRSHDNKYILKCVNKHEFKMFIETGFQYFHHNAKFLFHKMPSALAKILGAYKVKLKNQKSNKTENSYIILMENLFYGKEDLSKSNSIKAYDLKGSKSNRYIPKKDQKHNQVLPDTNFKEDFKGEPIPLEKNTAELLKAAIHNDSLILSKMNVVDYSLLLMIDENCGLENKDSIPYFNIKSIRVGIIDYVRKYTWDKQLEHVGKIIINRLQVPTIVNPVNYKERFKEAIDDYFIGL
jgi:hypothetical protein